MSRGASVLAEFPWEIPSRQAQYEFRAPREVRFQEGPPAMMRPSPRAHRGQDVPVRQVHHAVDDPRSRSPAPRRPRELRYGAPEFRPGAVDAPWQLPQDQWQRQPPPTRSLRLPRDTGARGSRDPVAAPGVPFRQHPQLRDYPARRDYAPTYLDGFLHVWNFQEQRWERASAMPAPSAGPGNG